MNKYYFVRLRNPSICHLLNFNETNDRWKGFLGFYPYHLSFTPALPFHITILSIHSIFVNSIQNHSHPQQHTCQNCKSFCLNPIDHSIIHKIHNEGKDKSQNAADDSRILYNTCNLLFQNIFLIACICPELVNFQKSLFICSGDASDIRHYTDCCQRYNEDIKT